MAKMETVVNPVANTEIYQGKKGLKRKCKKKLKNAYK